MCVGVYVYVDVWMYTVGCADFGGRRAGMRMYMCVSVYICMCVRACMMCDVCGWVC